jgi:hypothetical protein
MKTTNTPTELIFERTQSIHWDEGLTVWLPPRDVSAAEFWCRSRPSCEHLRDRQHRQMSPHYLCHHSPVTSDKLSSIWPSGCQVDFEYFCAIDFMMWSIKHTNEIFALVTSHFIPDHPENFLQVNSISVGPKLQQHASAREATNTGGFVQQTTASLALNNRLVVQQVNYTLGIWQKKFSPVH